MYPRTITVENPTEALVVEHALAMARELKIQADAAPDGQVFEIVEALTISEGRKFLGQTLENILQSQADAVEKKTRQGEPARAAAAPRTGVEGREKSSRRRGRSR